MGCCQSSTLTTVDQVSLANDKLREKPESHHEEFLTYEVSTNPFLKGSESSRGELVDLFLSYYSVGTKLRAFDVGERFICIQQSTNSAREVIQLAKSRIPHKILEVVLEKGCILANITHENLLKLHFAGENDTHANLVTDRCEHTLESLVGISCIDAHTAVQYLHQILRGLQQYHKAGVHLCRLTPREIFVIEGVLKISPLVIIPLDNSESQEILSESSGEGKGKLSHAPSHTHSNSNSHDKDIVRAARIFLSMITARVKLADIAEVLRQLQGSSMHAEDVNMICRVFSESGKGVSGEELMSYAWKFTMPLVYDMKKSLLESPIEIRDESAEVSHLEILQESPEELEVENQIELLCSHSSSLSVADEDDSLNAGGPCLIEEEVFEREGRKAQVENENEDESENENEKEVEIEYKGMDWEDQGGLVEAQIRISDLLQEDMNEILESIPEHEADSIEEFKASCDTEKSEECVKDPDTPILILHATDLFVEEEKDSYRISNENPLDQLTVEGPLITEKSSLQFTVSDSPVFDDRDIKDFDFPQSSLPQSDQVSLEFSSRDEIFESDKDREHKLSNDGQTSILEQPEELEDSSLPKTSEENCSSISPFRMAEDCLEQPDQTEDSFPPKAKIPEDCPEESDEPESSNLPKAIIEENYSPFSMAEECLEQSDKLVSSNPPNTVIEENPDCISPSLNAEEEHPIDLESSNPPNTIIEENPDCISPLLNAEEEHPIDLESSNPPKALQEHPSSVSPLLIFEESYSEKCMSAAEELVSIDFSASSQQDLNSVQAEDIEEMGIREHRSESLTCPKLLSRLSRVSLSSEIVLAEDATGKLKFYSFRNRYGFILWDRDASDIFLCEDDLVLSGIKLKDVKKAITKKIEMKFRFTVLKYVRDGNNARKAVNLEVLKDKL